MGVEIFLSSLAHIAGSLHKKFSLPVSARRTTSLTLYLNFCTGTSKQSFGNSFTLNSPEHFLLFCFGMQDVCCHVKHMKEKFLPAFYCLCFKQIIWQHLVWSVHTGLILTAVGFILWCAPFNEDASTSSPSWALIRKNASHVSFHFMAKRWTWWCDTFNLFSILWKILQYIQRDYLCNMLICITIENNLLYFLQCHWIPLCKYNLGFTGCLASFSLFGGLHIGLFHSVYVWKIMCYRIFLIYPTESCPKLHGNFYLSLRLQKMYVSNSTTMTLNHSQFHLFCQFW